MSRTHGDGVRQLCCAIYTRKSTEEGLDREFNSLDAQREACAAYILSQRHEGWTLAAGDYDDGGFTGGNMDRPGLKALLAEVQAGRVDVVVVYKVDRLTRSLSDFAKIVDVLDAAGASFVSVTQSFNTTTSMGRLTLNVLLSFAQFEREVISERVRDKVAASKVKGMWMGGVVPLGYDVVDRKLLPNVDEAKIVRMIMRRYLELGSVRELQDHLKTRGVLTKPQRMRDGSIRPGTSFQRGPLYHLLKNRIYRGEITHKGAVYPGEHSAIVDLKLFDAVQQKLREQAAIRSNGERAEHPSLLTGMIRDALGRTMSPSHTTKGGRRYRYYASNDPAQPDTAIRVNAVDLERAVKASIMTALADDGQLISDSASWSASDLHQLIDARDRSLPWLRQQSAAQDRRMFVAMGVGVEVADHEVTVTIDRDKAVTFFASSLSGRASGSITSSIQVSLRRYGHEKRLRIDASAAQFARASPPMLQLLAGAHAAREHLMELRVDGTKEQAARIRELRRRARLSYLSPEIVTMLVEGDHSRYASGRKLIRAGSIPLCWSEQMHILRSA